MDRANLAPDTALAARLFDDLRARSFDGVGITREAYGPGERMAHALVQEAAEALGLDCTADPVGNLHMVLRGRDPAARRIVLGSHLDSVPQGGNFDGAAGVLAGLAAVAGLRAAGIQPRCDIAVMAIRAEEGGAWFPTSYPGSRGALGRLPASELSIRNMATGRTLAEHMLEEGFDPGFVERGQRVYGPDTVEAFVEVHIEQGPVLEAEGIPVGIVTGIPGSRRHRAGRVHGQWNHSGGTPRRYRADAAVALAELVLGMDEAWGRLEARGHRLVCTFCTMGTSAEAGFTKIAGEAEFMLDIRSVDATSLDAIFAELDRLVPQIEARRGVRFDLGAQTSSTAAPLDAGLRAGLAEAAQAAGVPYLEMMSGGGHDAAAFSAAGVPAAMLFVRNQNGSHNPHEAMRMEDFDAACRVLTRWLVETAA